MIQYRGVSHGSIASIFDEYKFMLIIQIHVNNTRMK